MIRRAVIACALGLMLVPTVAHAAFPGENGRIAFELNIFDGVYTMNADGTDRRLVAWPGGDPAWSPDGSKIVFHWGGIWVVNPDGSGRTFLGQGYWPSWSPDGEQIVFTRDTASGRNIWVMNADGSGARRITDGHDYSAVWSPDGSRIAFHRQGLIKGLYTVKPDGSDLKQLSAFEDFDSAPAYSPDGRWIVFKAADGLSRIPAEGGPTTRLILGYRYPAWSPDGTKIAFTNETEIFVMNADGSNPVDITNTPFDGETAIQETRPDWQPVNEPPDCTAVRATPELLGAPNHKLVTVTISGATDPEGDAVDLAITGVTQDELLGDEAEAVATTGPDQVQLRAERDPHGDGRVYRIAFEGSDGRGGRCEGYATVSVRKGNSANDSAPPSYDSFGS